jgi:uncharacterized membrane protein HdeD (DUF308 family)
MRTFGFVLLVIGCFAVAVNRFVHTVLTFGRPPSPPSVEGLVVWGAVALLGGLLRHYAKTNSAAAMMQSTKMQPTKRNSRVTMFVGLIVAGFGALGLYECLDYKTKSMWVPFFGAILVAVGCAIFLRGFDWRESSVFSWVVLMIGLLMLVIGGCPWLYTPYVIGGRPGNEAAGMLGTLLFICVGLPGLAIVLFALKLKFKNHKEGGPDA